MVLPDAMLLTITADGSTLALTDKHCWYASFRILREVSFMELKSRS